MTEPTLPHAGPPSAAQPLFILAMDHRDSFGPTLFGVKDDTPTDQQLAVQSLLAEVGALREEAN